ncbi:MAG: peptidylprolyl isomerase [Betaproteobacteria bacterium]
MKQSSKLAASIVAGVVFAWAGVAPAQTIVKPDAVLASTSKTKVTYEDLMAEMERLPEENRLEFLLSAQRLATVVENILITKIMAAEAQESGLQNRAKVAAELRNQTERVLAKYRREDLEAGAPKIDLTSLAREIFLTRMKDLERPALYSTWHTLIKVTDRSPAAALERAKIVKAKVDAGEDLSSIAKKYSDDESASTNAGNIDPAPLSVLDNGFAAAIEKLKPGESTIVETAYGIHVVRLLKVVPANRPTFEDVKPAMLLEADKIYKQRLLETYLAKIRNDPTLKVNKDVLDQVRPRLPEIPPPAPAPTRKL